MISEYKDNNYLQNTILLHCPSCASQLGYTAEHKKLSCEYCGYQEEYDRSNDKIIEQSLHDAVTQVKDFIPEATGKKVFDCDNCGAKFMVEHDKVKVSCGFCGSNNANVEAFEHQYIQPVGIIPFYISREEADKLFAKWVRGGFFHPSKLKKLAAVETLHGIYMPFWTYDANISATWSGEAGTYYYETRRVRINGKMQTQRVQKVRWAHRSGRLDHFFDDVLVVGSDSLEQKHVDRVLPFRLNELVNYDPRLMVNWEVDIYKTEVDQGYEQAEVIMDHKTRNMCSAQLGGDTQRNLHVKSQKSGQTFKHIILPFWICAYMYNNKTYHFTINGQTGKVYGKKPISWYKIAGLVLLFALFIFAVWYLRYSGILQK